MCQYGAKKELNLAIMNFPSLLRVDLALQYRWLIQGYIHIWTDPIQMVDTKLGVHGVLHSQKYSKLIVFAHKFMSHH